MFPKTLFLTYGYALIAALLAALTVRPAAALLTTPKCHLFTAVSAPITPNSPVSIFTEATFTGYSVYSLSAFSGPVYLDDATGYALLANPLYIAGSLSASQVILGYWIDDGATAFYGAETFQSPINIVNPGDFVDLSLLLPFSSPMKA